MNSLKKIFKLATTIALIAWFAIIALPFWSYVNAVAWSAVVVIGVIYLYMLFIAKFPEFEKTRGSFLSLDGVIALFKSPHRLLNLWLHVLAFDLVAAIYIRHDAMQVGISHLWLIPIYLLTLMFGPAGLLAYLALRTLLTT